MIQLDFFETEEESEIVTLRKEINHIGGVAEKVRKGMYARLGEQKKEIEDLKERLWIIERNICNGK